MTDNPYVSGSATTVTQVCPPNHRRRTFALGMTLLVMSIAWVFGLMFGVGFFTLSAMEPGSSAMAFPAYIFLGVAMIYNAVLAVGAVGILRRGSYAAANVILCMAIVPMIGPFYFAGTVIGIWGLIVLRKPEIRESFGR